MIHFIAREPVWKNRQGTYDIDWSWSDRHVTNHNYWKWLTRKTQSAPERPPIFPMSFSRWISCQGGTANLAKYIPGTDLLSSLAQSSRKSDKTREWSSPALKNTVFTKICDSYRINSFGTPHKGGNHVKLGQIAANFAKLTLQNPLNPFIDTLQKDFLFAQGAWAAFFEDFRIISFFETFSYNKALGLVSILLPLI